MMFDPTPELGRPGAPGPGRSSTFSRPGRDQPDTRPGWGRLYTEGQRGGRKTAGRPKGPAPSSRNADGSKPSCMTIAAPVAVSIGTLAALIVRRVR